ncbi:oligosaccharide flippase family protein [Novosphingobium sp.]|uniref:lipopolysaccharide biosynthesis protein n=1 Tax=Novosphingobium sp. TaxID=1874826 RepID=UPI00261EF1B8|nr:oligosaccharide flippase family protein [Novosphingobium sp.]
MKKVLFAFLATGVMQLSSFASGIMLARMLSPSLRGEVAQVIAWFSFIVPVMMLGINDSVAYFRSRNPAEGTAVLAGAFLLSIPFILIATLMCITVILTIFSSSSALAISGAWLFLFYAPFYQWQQIFYSYFQAGARPAVWTIARVLPGLVYISGLFLVWYSGHASPANVIAANVISLAVTLVVCAGIVLRSGEPFKMPETALIGRVFRFGVPVIFQRIAIVCRDNLDRMILPFFVTASDLGHYVVAGSIAYLIYVVGMTIDLVGFPAMAAVKDDDARRRLAELCISMTFLMLIILVTCFAFVIEPLVLLLFGKNYAASTALAPWFLIAGAAQALRIVVGGAFKAFNLSGPMMRFEFVGSVIMLVVLVGGGSHFGVFAGALAHIISAFVSLAIALYAAVQTLKLSPRRLMLPSKSNFVLMWSILSRNVRPADAPKGNPT